VPVCPCGRSSVGLWPVGYGGGVGLLACAPVPVPPVGGRSTVGRWSVPVDLWPSVGLLAVGGHPWAVCALFLFLCHIVAGGSTRAPCWPVPVGGLPVGLPYPQILRFSCPVTAKQGAGRSSVPLCPCWRSMGELFDVCQYLFHEVGGVCPVGIIIIQISVKIDFCPCQ